MGMTQLTLVFMGSLATLATIGMFVNFGDDATRVLVSFTASIIWGFFGMSAFDVYVNETATKSEPILPLAYLGIGFSIIVGLFALFALMQAIRGETEQTTANGLM